MTCPVQGIDPIRNEWSFGVRGLRAKALPFGPRIEPAVHVVKKSRAEQSRSRRRNRGSPAEIEPANNAATSTPMESFGNAKTNRAQQRPGSSTIPECIVFDYAS